MHSDYLKNIMAKCASLLIKKIDWGSALIEPLLLTAGNFRPKQLGPVDHLPLTTNA